jgi:hypothetical protein
LTFAPVGGILWLSKLAQVMCDPGFTSWRQR